MARPLSTTCAENVSAVDEIQVERWPYRCRGLGGATMSKISGFRNGSPNCGESPRRLRLDLGEDGVERSPLHQALRVAGW